MNTAEFLTSPALSRAGFRHAFFTRNGGASVGPYASLSFSIAVGDHPDDVRENLVRAARALDVAPDKLFFLSQVHGRDVHRVDAESSRKKKGTGLGLAIVKHIVHRHRGQLSIRSTPGEGTRVEVLLNP